MHPLSLDKFGSRARQQDGIPHMNYNYSAMVTFSEMAFKRVDLLLLMFFFPFGDSHELFCSIRQVHFKTKFEYITLAWFPSLLLADASLKIPSMLVAHGASI